MKKLAVLLLIALAVAYYFGYEPSDLIPSVPGNNTPSARVRPTASPEEQKARLAPSKPSLVAVNAQDGSMANRWTPDASAPPK